MSTQKLIRTMTAKLEVLDPPIEVLEAKNVNGHVHMRVACGGREMSLNFGSSPRCEEHEINRVTQRIRRYFRTQEPA